MLSVYLKSGSTRDCPRTTYQYHATSERLDGQHLANGCNEYVCAWIAQHICRFGVIMDHDSRCPVSLLTRASQARESWLRSVCHSPPMTFGPGRPESGCDPSSTRHLQYSAHEESCESCSVPGELLSWHLGVFFFGAVNRLACLSLVGRHRRHHHIMVRGESHREEYNMYGLGKASKHFSRRPSPGLADVAQR